MACEAVVQQEKNNDNFQIKYFQTKLNKYLIIDKPIIPISHLTNKEKTKVMAQDDYKLAFQTKKYIKKYTSKLGLLSKIVKFVI